MDYEASTDKPTIVNLTYHSYFNLAGCKESVLNHYYMIAGDSITPVDSMGIPTGELMAVAGTEYIAGALRKVHNHFGDEFIITMAPETYYMQSPTSNYFKLALDIKDILTVVNMQYYNSGSMVGYGGGVYSCGSVDFLTSLATLLIENGLRPDQVGIGVPSSAPAAGSGLVSTNTLTSALRDPSCILQSDTSIYSNIDFNFLK